jgi:hypothetical protein
MTSFVVLVMAVALQSLEMVHFSNSVSRLSLKRSAEHRDNECTNATHQYLLRTWVHARTKVIIDHEGIIAVLQSVLISTNITEGAVSGVDVLSNPCEYKCLQRIRMSGSDIYIG